MGVKSLSRALSHIAVTTVTPYSADGSVDYERMSDQTRFLIDSGITVLVPAGNTGEFSSLSLSEIKRVTETVATAAAGRATVVAGIGHATPIAIELARHAEQVDAAAVMVHHPRHSFIDPAGLRRYYERILSELTTGLVIYKRGPEIPDELVHTLAQDPRVVAVKYAVNDLNAFTRLVASTPDKVTWMCGSGERWAPFFWLGGARGFSSGLANFAPDVSLAMLEALRSGDFARAMTIRARVAAFEDLRDEGGGAANVPAIKEAMHILSLGPRSVREPLAELNPERRRRVERTVEQIAARASVDQLSAST